MKREYCRDCDCLVENADGEWECDSAMALISDIKWCPETGVPSSTGGDYGPSNPWDAPGMKISDFI